MSFHVLFCMSEFECLVMLQCQTSAVDGCFMAGLWALVSNQSNVPRKCFFTLCLFACTDESPWLNSLRSRRKKLSHGLSSVLFEILILIAYCLGWPLFGPWIAAHDGDALFLWDSDMFFSQVGFEILHLWICLPCLKLKCWISLPTLDLILINCHWLTATT